MGTIHIISINNGINYFHHPDHRNNNPAKSQWTISQSEEITCFKNALRNNWMIDDEGWGLHFNNNEISYLGLSIDRYTQLYIAKFVNNSNNVNWHGYPADFHRNQQDTPKLEIMNDWLNSGIFTAAKIKKMITRKKCNL